MMHVKTYEELVNDGDGSTIKPNYEVGDLVVCIFNFSKLVKYGETYKVSKIWNTTGKYYCDVETLGKTPTIVGSSVFRSFYCSKFVSLEEWEIDKNINKYNI